MPETATPTLSGPVCGTCRHAEPDWDLVACTLGWEGHERPISSHSGVPLPLLAPQTRCMALGGNRRTPRREAMV